MKNLFLSALFVATAFLSTAQQVTISGFGTKEKFGPVNSKTEFDKILLDDYEASPSEGLPYGYKYVIDFNSNRCTLFDGDGRKVETVEFVAISKVSDRDFQIEFKDPNNEFDMQSGIVLKDDIGAYSVYNGLSVILYIFDACYIN